MANTQPKITVISGRKSTRLAPFRFAHFFWLLLVIVILSLVANVVAVFLIHGTSAPFDLLQLPVVIFVRSNPILSLVVAVATVILAAVGFYVDRIAQLRDQFTDVSYEIPISPSAASYKLFLQDPGPFSGPSSYSRGFRLFNRSDPEQSSSLWDPLEIGQPSANLDEREVPGFSPILYDYLAKINEKISNLQDRFDTLEHDHTRVLNLPPSDSPPSPAPPQPPRKHFSWRRFWLAFWEWIGRGANVSQILVSLPVIAVIIGSIVALLTHH